MYPTYCPLCALPVDRPDQGCSECGIFWCCRCERWRGWKRGADDNMPEACDNCWMPGCYVEEDEDLFEELVVAYTCTAVGCKEARGKDEVFCKRHWFDLPKIVRDEIWEAHRANDRDRSLRAIRQAIKHLQERD